MKRFVVAAILATSSTFTFAADQQCLANKYDGYVDASLQWYQDLVDLTVTQYPDLDDVSQWFLDGRKHHFELNREAVHYFLKHDPSRVATELPVEAWLKLEQHDVKQLASRSDKLGEAAQKTFTDRQSTNHEKNYELRSAFADLLSHPQKIDSALNKYNQSIEKLEKQKCN
ncbi:hypothetical protein AB3Y13_14590 [Vibrio alginolyticus]|uniref:hypothetical protein n=1 Tax=Vibrio sp. B1FLJ16 TaxID=2751178 RepID=UPI0015F6F6E7|nr:hypothetical protein [Vibrio sp. B1FLJ16]MCA0936059.1 hypothetical protein [Vibrio alginolyticus]CAD7804174.1 hypothetical protein ACOMICROBIO_FLGHMIGD_01202 [Vibrio sp. B1FLJ16]CAD7804360.1 hypothetical protein ACOMICROBIO_EPCKBFOG_01229 [Vibrio sp. B1FLJ16]CAE6896739.1 hypothetical protein ACOMICROBIO_FLGHMIGD_01202 [Vibrio sp. B1FLJ16]CAE6898037.1 hypothetical protein ACOMICROBIO_EPCKBFOG_01229 [Vibrio sp. B1FLJ16]